MASYALTDAEVRTIVEALDAAANVGGSRYAELAGRFRTDMAEHFHGNCMRPESGTERRFGVNGWLSRARTSEEYEEECRQHGVKPDPYANEYD